MFTRGRLTGFIVSDVELIWYSCWLRPQVGRERMKLAVHSITYKEQHSAVYITILMHWTQSGLSQLCCVGYVALEK